MIWIQLAVSVILFLINFLWKKEGKSLSVREAKGLQDAVNCCERFLQIANQTRNMTPDESAMGEIDRRTEKARRPKL